MRKWITAIALKGPKASAMPRAASMSMSDGIGAIAACGWPGF